MKALLLALLFLSGCAINIPPLDVRHTTAFYSTRAELVAAYPGTVRPNRLINGFAEYGGKVCRIHLLIRDSELMACALRHEQRHCISGDWHPNGDNSDCDTNGRGLGINGDWSY